MSFHKIQNIWGDQQWIFFKETLQNVFPKSAVSFHRSPQLSRQPHKDEEPLWLCLLFWYLITVTQHKFYLLGTGQVSLLLNKFINCCFWLERLQLSFLSIHVQWCEDGLIAFSGFIRSCATRCVLISKSPSFLEHLLFKDPDTPRPDKTRYPCESLMRFWLKNIESFSNSSCWM